MLPVTYVSGDSDNDNLLDTPTSIFEDASDEVWTFTCTTTITATTTNTAVVTGTPTFPDGTPLCDVPQGFAPAQQQTPPCDPTGTTTATVTVVAPGTITIVKRTTLATTRDFDFTYNDQPFVLKREYVADVRQPGSGPLHRDGSRRHRLASRARRVQSTPRATRS